VRAIDDLAKNLGCGQVSTQEVDWDGHSPVAQLGTLDETRLYIVAHGNESGTRAAGVSGVDMARALAVDAGLSKNVALISLAICLAGNEATGLTAGLANYWNPSFARSFHAALGKHHDIYTVVHARAGEVTVLGSERIHPAIPNDDFSLWGRKMVKMNGQYGFQPKGSKYRYYWKDDVQIVGEVY
jgi:hypothetical protein